jgi:hypothetical protein
MSQEGVKSFACHMANVRSLGYRKVKRGQSEGRKWMKLIENWSRAPVSRLIYSVVQRQLRGPHE